MAKNVVIIGGGASGLMAAIWASRLGAAVTVLEKNDKPGRKLLATGNGRCNFTNRYQDASCYRTGNQERASRVLEQFTEQDTEQFFEQLGIRIRSREGWLYPASEQAQSVLELLILEARFRKVKIKTRETAVAVEKAENGYLVRTEGWQYPADSVIICCGSCASQIAGSDGDTLRFADQLQLASIPFFPALCPLRCKGNQFSSWAGVRLRAKITLLVENQEILTEQGELQLTDYGVSGIPVFQISRFATCDPLASSLTETFCIQRITEALKSQARNAYRVSGFTTSICGEGDHVSVAALPAFRRAPANQISDCAHVELAQRIPGGVERKITTPVFDLRHVAVRRLRDDAHAVATQHDMWSLVVHRYCPSCLILRSPTLVRALTFP